MKICKLPVVAAVILLTASCKKEFPSQRPPQQSATVDPGKVFKTPSTPEEKLLVENLGKLGGILKELYKE